MIYELEDLLNVTGNATFDDLKESVKRINPDVIIENIVSGISIEIPSGKYRYLQDSLSYPFEVEEWYASIPEPIGI